MLEGLTLALTPMSLFLVVAGVAAGAIIGALPGLTAAMSAAIIVPFTFALEPTTGLMFIGALYIGAMMGDAIPAILVNVPGTPGAMVTALDGYPLTEQGRAQSALIAAVWASFVGAFIGGLALLLLSPLLARAALAFGPPELFWLGVFAVTIMGALVGDSFLRGLAGGTLGLLLSTVGTAPAGGVQRFTFGFYQLMGGISIAAALIGLFAIPQLISLAEHRFERTKEAKWEPEPNVIRKVWPIISRPVNLIRSSALGIFGGVLPGSGGTLASILSYNEARRWSKDRDTFGKGNLKGIVASETANNAAATSSMVPLLSLGVPGSNVAAILLGALLVHGLRPGPILFRDNPGIAYGFIWAMILGSIVVLILGALMAPLLARTTKTPLHVLIPTIAALTMVGSFAVRSNIFDTYLMFVIGMIGYFSLKMKIPLAAIALGLILGPIVERGLDVSLQMTRTAGWFTVFFTRPISLVLIGMTALSIWWTFSSRKQETVGKGAVIGTS